MIEEVDGETAPESLLRALHLVEVEADPLAPGEPTRSVQEAIDSFRNPGPRAARAGSRPSTASRPGPPRSPTTAAGW